MLTALIYKLKKQANPRQVTWPAVYEARPFIQARASVYMVPGVEKTVGDWPKGKIKSTYLAWYCVLFQHCSWQRYLVLA